MSNSKVEITFRSIIIESPFFRQVFLSHHQNSHSSWSLMCRNPPEEAVAHYGCKVWGLQRSLGSYVSSFIAEILEAKKKVTRLWHRKQNYRVLAYTDIGLILLYVTTYPADQTYYVANPISKQRIKIPETEESWFREVLGLVKSDVLLRQARLVTRTKDGVVLGFKVVLVGKRHTNSECFVAFIVYSSETGSGSSKALQSPLPLLNLYLLDAVSLSGNLHWLGLNRDFQEVLVFYDFYGSDDQCRVIPFPDLKKVPKFKRSCTTSGGYLMYMNIFSEYNDSGCVEHKLSVWRLMNREWQLVSELKDFDYLPQAINPFDADTLYMWSQMQDSLVSINLRNGSFELHNELERSKDGQTLSSVQYNRERDTMQCLSQSHFSMFVLSRWLYRTPIPPTPF